MKKLCERYNVHFLEVYFFLSLCAVGLFHEYLSSLAGVVLCLYLFWQARRKKTLRLHWNLTAAALLAMTVFYLLSAFWAVDSGMAFWGFVKYLPAGLFLLVLWQSDNGRERVWRVTVFTAAFMTVVSAVGMQIPALAGYFSVGERLSGFFQYSNTFALFLTVALALVGTKDALTWRDYALMLVFVFGVLYSGSRTVFVLMVLVVAALIVFRVRGRARIALGGGFLAVICAAGLYALLSGSDEGIGRFVRLSVTESTFLGRLLYFRDAAGVILRHPFGVGYMGYYYLQTSVQTGVYSVRFIHNDFLQLMLDAGWLPALLLIAAMVKAFFRRGDNALRRRLVIFLFAAHGCFDFDMQFLAMASLLVASLDYDEGKARTVKARTGTLCAACAAGALCLYMGAAELLYSVGLYKASETLYPWNTQADTALMSATEDAGEMEAIADRIIARNGHVSVAYSAKALAAYSRGDIGGVIEYMDMVLDEAPFLYDEYEQYAYMLIYGIESYTAQGDTASAAVCREKLLETAQKLEAVNDRLSRLGSMISDQPVTELPEDVREYIAALEG